jgi:hypothetical protein
MSHRKRDKSLSQLSNNYCWSSIVLEELTKGTGEHRAYGTDSDNTVSLAAGDRAPDASGLLTMQPDAGRELTFLEILKYATRTLGILPT